MLQKKSNQIRFYLKSTKKKKQFLDPESSKYCDTMIKWIFGITILGRKNVSIITYNNLKKKKK